jgi:hypothetical protein
MSIEIKVIFQFFFFFKKIIIIKKKKFKFIFLSILIFLNNLFYQLNEAFKFKKKKKKKIFSLFMI